MKKLHPPCWLTHDELGRLRVGESGLLIGRSLDCDLVLPDPRTSRHHALVREGPSGPILIPLGRNPLGLNDSRVTQVMPLQHGDRVQFPDCTLAVELHTSTRPTGRAWLMMRERGTLIAAVRGSLRLGGALEDDLVIPGWPPGAARLDVVGRSLLATFNAPGQLDHEPHPADAVVQVISNNMLAFGEERVRLLLQREHSHSTVLVSEAEQEEPLDTIRLTSGPGKGARLVLRFDEREVSLELSELRARLVTALARAGGEPVRDEPLMAQVFPPSQRRNSRDLALLIHRLRTVLVQAEVDPYRLIGREGDSTWLRRGAATTITLD